MGKKKDKKPQTFEDSGDEAEQAESAESVMPAKNKKKAASSKVAANAFAMLADDDETAMPEDNNEEPEPTPEPEPEPIKAAPKKNDKKGGNKNEKPAPAKKDKKKKNDNDYLASLADDGENQDAPAPAEPKAEPVKQQDKGGKKKKNKKDAADYLSQLDDPEAEAAPAPAAEKLKEDSKKKDNKKMADDKKPATPAAAEPKKKQEKPAPSSAKHGNSALRALMEQKRKEEEARLEEERRREEEEERLLQQLRDQEKNDKKEVKKKLDKKAQKKKEEEEALKAKREALLRSGAFVAALNPENDKPKPATPPPAKKTPKPEEKKPEEPKPAEAAPAPAPAEEPERESWEDLLDELDAPEKPAEEPAKSIEQPKPVAASEQKQASKTEVAAAEKPKSADANKKDDKELRSPICCVLGHVDTGKTKILDKIRNTNVQLGEAGGITQQIGATYIPIDALKKEAKKLGEKHVVAVKIPGLLIIDTPGHESFTNLRSRGTNLCDIAILVVDIMHGLERQTIESINLLKQRKVPFIVALNKVDQIYDWKPVPNTPIRESLKKQPKHTIVQFDDRVKKTIGYFNEQGFNAALYYENKDYKNFVSLVPTSAHTGEGIPDLLTLMMQLTQHFMGNKIAYKDEFQCSVLEFKVVEGHGTTIDVVLVNGVIREGDKIVVCTLNGPVVTTIRSLLVPKPLKEIRVKGEYIAHKEVRAAMGIKIAAQDLDGAVPGSSLLLVKPGDDIEDLKDAVMVDLKQMLTRVTMSGKGVYVQASTLGSLEALLDFLNSENIPVCGINVGPVHKKDVIMASVMLESNPEYAIIMAFDVPVTKEAQAEADKVGVQIFKADIIYHLCDKFMAHMNKIKEEKKKQTQMEAVWPCIIKIIPNHVFHKRDPITVGVDVVEGVLKVGTPLIIPTRDNLEIGRCMSIQHQKVTVNEASKGKAVSIQIDSGKNIMVGRHFEETDIIYSKITRNSIDLLKQHFKDDLKKDDLKLLQKIKKVLNVPDAVKAMSKKDDSDEDV